MSLVGHDINDLQPAFPDRSVNEVEQIVHDNRLCLRRSYEGFGYLAIRQCDSQFFNIGSDGSRSTGREKSQSRDFCRIHSYGGSTTLGENVSDSETVSSQLEKLLNSKDNLDCSVFNYGAGNHTSLHSTLRLLFHCLSGNIPNIAIFLNGYNDLFYSSGGEDGIADFFDQILLCSQDLTKYETRLSDLVSKIPSSISRFNEERVDLSEEMTLDCFDNIRRRYGTALAIQNHIEEFFDVKVIRFIEPSAAVFCRPDQNLLPKLFEYGTRGRIANHLYRELSFVGLESVFGKHLHSLLDVGQDRLDIPLFLDGTHFTPQMNQILATKIYSLLNNKWFKQKVSGRSKGVRRSDSSELTNPNNYPLF